MKKVLAPATVAARTEDRRGGGMMGSCSHDQGGGMDIADDVVQIYVTHPDRQALGRLVDRLVGSHAIASANIAGPLASTYFWDGRTEHAEEWSAFMKTARTRVDEVVAAIGEVHPYEVPAIIVSRIDGGFAPYLEWIRQTTRDSSSGDGPEA
jgi:periplasmic divalent cation tolerance protein